MKRASIACSDTASDGAEMALLKACRSVVQVLDHEGKGDATGTEVVAQPREPAMPKPQPQQATWAPR